MALTPRRINQAVSNAIFGDSLPIETPPTTSATPTVQTVSIPMQTIGPSPHQDFFQHISTSGGGVVTYPYASSIKTVNVTEEEITKLREDTKLLRDAFTGFYKIIFKKEPKNFETAIIEVNQYLVEKGLDEIVLDVAHKKALASLSNIADQI